MSRRRAALGAALAVTALAVPARPGAEPAACRAAAGDLTGEQREAAAIAWRYFERNLQPETGFVSSVEGYPATTAWDLGSSVLATIAARELRLIEHQELDRRITPLLRTLETMPLFEGALPNKSYHAATGAMTDYANRPAPAGIGASAMDVARLVSALRAVACFHPEYLERVQRVLARWRTCDLVRDGQLHGATRDASGAIAWHQEGRLGYEQYAARALAWLGFPLDRISRYDHSAVEVEVEGVPIPQDARDPSTHGARNPVLTEPWALTALELGRDARDEPLLRRILDVQKRRWETTGIPTAVSEDHVDVAPWFVYDAIVEGGVPWRTVTPQGEDVPELHALSTKAAFALAALYPRDPYSRVLLDAVAGARDPERGWYAGVYARGSLNRSLNANTNAVILETVLYRAVGTIHAACARCDRFPWPAGASAGARQACTPVAGSAPGERADGAATPAALAAGSGAAPQPTVQPQPAPQPQPTLRLSGATFSSYRPDDGPAAGVIATWTPWSYFFLRAGGAVTPLWRGGATRALWGLGYDDWHENTFSIQVNNWGPIQPESQDVGLRGAQLDLAYKVPRLCAGSVCLATMPFATVPFAGGPYVGARANLTFRERWFLFGGIGWVIPGVLQGPAGTPRWRPMFGVGLWDWRSGTIFVHYYNWGPSSSLRNGVISVGMNWTY